MTSRARSLAGILLILFCPILAGQSAGESDALERSVDELRSVIGRWETVTELLNEDGSISKTVDGTYEFSWVIPDRVIAGTSEIPELGQTSAILFYINEARGVIEMTTVGADGRLWIMTGPLGGDQRVSQEFATANGSSRLRFTRSNVSSSTFESKMEYTEDGGRSWKPGNHQTFRRAGASRSSSGVNREKTEQAPIFRFTTDRFWLNLHHYLYVLGRVEMGAPDVHRRAVAGAPADQERGLAGLTAEEKRIWTEAVAFYAAGPSKRDTIFDSRLVAATQAVARVTGRSLEALEIPPEWRRTLERAAPIYRKAWWPAHRAANESRLEDYRRQVDRYGEQMLALITAWYGQRWPEDGFPVHLSAFTNWAGAYSTTGNLLVMSSLDSELSGSLGLETIFHESMHQWDAAINGAIAAAAREQGLEFPESLSHALIFYTAGEAARRTVPGHVPYAEKAGVWRRRSGVFLPALQQAWRPYLDGEVGREAALEELVRLADAAVR